MLVPFVDPSVHVVGGATEIDPTGAFGLGSAVALVCGYEAKRQIRRSGGTEQGDGLATAGIIFTTGSPTRPVSRSNCTGPCCRPGPRWVCRPSGFWDEA